MDHTAPLPASPDPLPPVPPVSPAPLPPAPPATPPVETPKTPPSAPPATETPTPNPPRLIRHATPFRILLVVMVMFVGLFLTLRTLAVEPFGVPTGSMAPTLSGHHRAAPCPRCGYLVRVGRPSSGSLTEHYARVACPNCDLSFSMAEARDLSGDRLLVDKNVYCLRNPRRWEMVVFRCPDPDPKEFGKPYVK